MTETQKAVDFMTPRNSRLTACAALAREAAEMLALAEATLAAMLAAGMTLDQKSVAIGTLTSSRHLRDAAPAMVASELFPSIRSAGTPITALATLPTTAVTGTSATQ